MTDFKARAKFGDQLRKALHRRSDIKQAQLAIEIGVTKGMVSSYVHGRNLPSRKKLLLMAEELGVEAEWLLTGKAPMRARTWAHYSRRLAEIDGRGNRLDEPNLGLEDLASVEAEFWGSFSDGPAYKRLAPVVHVVFGNLLERALRRYREANGGRVSSPSWRGKFATILLDFVFNASADAGYDQHPASTRAFVTALGAEMGAWEAGSPGLDTRMAEVKKRLPAEIDLPR